MSEKKYDNGGVLFRNRNKETDRHPDYTGNLTVGGTEYWLSAWIKEGQRGKFFSLSIKPKQQAATSASLADDMNDSIPF